MEAIDQLLSLSGVPRSSQLPIGTAEPGRGWGISVAFASHPVVIAGASLTLTLADSAQEI
ncbi:hypothetical protein GCM10009555_031100 [Acrocarpospora macrocephala]|uniref:Uncharacterized protein n=1 Tax=Acrocarpospora macrocephala TaxID=150177 RepID=A0A5M3WYM9_9ACTN|nr:hypothetical protein Amac_060380 [Acrocarpospora macrocephala]